MGNGKIQQEGEIRFWENAALNAMQGLMESQIKAESAIGVVAPEILAKESFRIADAMLKEYRRRVADMKAG
jgi:hypothetical protein